MSLSPLVYWALGFLAVALAGLFISSKTLKIDLDKNGELIIAMLTILGTLVSILLGLLVSSADDQYRTMEACVNTEATSVNEVFRLSRGLPKEAAYAVQDKCIEYCKMVVNTDWPSMRKGEPGIEVTREFANLNDVIVGFHPRSEGEVALQNSMLTALSSVGQNRGLRIVACRSTWTQRLLPLILTCAIVVLSCSYLYVGRGSPLLHAVLTGLVAITLGTNVGVIFLMTRPFTSEWTIQPEGFELSLKLMESCRHTLAPALPGDNAIQKPAKQ
jgi:hypothetical protein